MKELFKINRSWDGNEEDFDKEDERLFEELIDKLKQKSFLKEKKALIYRSLKTSTRRLELAIELQNIQLTIQTATVRSWFQKKYRVYLDLYIDTNVQTLSASFQIMDFSHGLASSLNLDVNLNIFLNMFFLRDLSDLMIDDHNFKKKFLDEIHEIGIYVSLVNFKLK